MPCVEVKTSKKLTAQQETELAEKMAKALKDVFGKPEDGLMAEFVSGQTFYFHCKNQDDAALLRCSFWRHNPPEKYDAYTAELCKIYKDMLGVPGENMYVIYHETDHWGYDGANL